VSSKPSDINELFGGIDDALDQIKSLDLEGISLKVKDTLDDINQAVTDFNVKGISGRAESALASADRILESQRWERILVSVEEAGQSLNALLAKADGSLNKLDGALTGAENLLNGNEAKIGEAVEDFRLAVKNANLLMEKGVSAADGANETVIQLQRQLTRTGQNLERASENLDRLLDLLADHPSQLLFGEPPAPREVEAGAPLRENANR
jgi:phospholipid/cholesterol/gamma-HCH transport system substrate-binding protein